MPPFLFYILTNYINHSALRFESLQIDRKDYYGK